MLSKIWMINLILAVLIGISWIGIWDIQQSKEVQMPEMTATAKEEVSPVKTGKNGQKLANEADYDAIVNKDLFLPERVADIPTKESQAAAEELNVSGEKVMLYGVVMLDGFKSALINNPLKSSDGKEYRWVKEGDRISNLKVVEIQKNQIMLKDGAAKYKISLFDQKKGKKRANMRSSREAPKVMSFGGKTTASSRSPSAGGSASALSPVAQQKEESKVVGTGETTRPAQSSSAKTSARSKISDDGQYQIIETPFGTIKKKIK